MNAADIDNNNNTTKKGQYGRNLDNKSLRETSLDLSNSVLLENCCIQIKF